MKNTLFIGVYPGIDDKKLDYVIAAFDKFFESI
jgi:dTDP-4-amino-4,6-dideoxygalactose transaminase